MSIVLVGLLAGNVLLLLLVGYLAVRASQASTQKESLVRLTSQSESLAQQLTLARADLATRLEQTKGDIRQQVTDRLSSGFSDIRTAVEGQLAGGRREQAERLAESR